MPMGDCFLGIGRLNGGRSRVGRLGDSEIDSRELLLQSHVPLISRADRYVNREIGVN